MHNYQHSQSLYYYHHHLILSWLIPEEGLTWYTYIVLHLLLTIWNPALVATKGRFQHLH